MFEQGLDLTMTRRKAGVNVTTATASQLTAVYACWRIISEAIATLPRAAEYETEGRWLDAANQPAWLNTPNETDTWVEMLGQTMVSLLAGGDAYNMIVWNTAADGGGVKEIIVLNPTTCRRVSDTTVTVTPTDGTPPRDYRVLTASSSNSRPVEILHLRGMGHPGARVGMSPIEACAETIGVSLAAQRYGASFFANDGTPSGVLEVPPETDLSDTGRKALRESWAELHGGPNRAKQVAVLTRGVKFKALQISPNEAQFLETRKMGVQEIARLYGTPPHLIGDTTNTTGWGTRHGRTKHGVRDSYVEAVARTTRSPLHVAISCRTNAARNAGQSNPHSVTRGSATSWVTRKALGSPTQKRCVGFVDRRRSPPTGRVPVVARWRRRRPMDSTFPIPANRRTRKRTVEWLKIQKHVF